MGALQSLPQGVLGSLLLLGLQSGLLPLGLLLGQLVISLLLSSLFGFLLPLLLDSGLESRFLRILLGEGRGISLRSLLLDSFDLLVVGTLGGELFGLLLGFLGGLVDDLSLGIDDFSQVELLVLGLVAVDLGRDAVDVRLSGNLSGLIAAGLEGGVQSGVLSLLEVEGGLGKRLLFLLGVASGRFFLSPLLLRLGEPVSLLLRFLGGGGQSLFSFLGGLVLGLLLAALLGFLGFLLFLETFGFGLLAGDLLVLETLLLRDLALFFFRLLELGFLGVDVLGLRSEEVHGVSALRAHLLLELCLLLGGFGLCEGNLALLLLLLLLGGLGLEFRLFR